MRNAIKPWISTKEAAERMGISSSTFKRLCDANDIQVVRTPGGHRRIDSSQFEIASRLVSSRGQSPAQAALEIEDVISYLLDADHLELIECLYRTAPTLQLLVKLLEDVFVPSLWRIGDLWRRNELVIAQEKVCSSTAALVLDGLATRFKLPPKESRTFVGASFPQSLDTLASKLVSIALMSIHIRPIYLGCNIAPEFIAQTVSLYRAEAVWISHTHITDLSQVILDHDALRNLLPAGTRVIIGGGGLSPSARRSIDDCTYYDSIDCLIQNERDLAVT